MSKKEETLTAIQNIGATVFVIGVIGGCMAVTPLTLMICAGAMVVGSVTIAIAEYKLDRLCEYEERKGGCNGNKGKKAC